MSSNLVKNYRERERGSANIKLLLTLAIFITLANAGYNYIPVAYQGENFKQEMQKIVILGVALPSNGANPVESMKARLKKVAQEYDLPPSIIDVKQVNNITYAHVHYSREVSIVPFGIYDYDYEFDHTATPTGFLTKN